VSEGQDSFVLRFLHTQFGDMPARVAKLTEHGSGIRGHSLVEKELEGDTPGLAHAAGNSEVSSAKFAAANSSAWRTSSSSRSG
jgi:hypothetical protein